MLGWGKTICEGKSGTSVKEWVSYLDSFFHFISIHIKISPEIYFFK